MAWKPGQSRLCVPLPLTNNDDELEWSYIYETGLCKIEDTINLSTGERRERVPHKQVRALMPGDAMTFKRLLDSGNSVRQRSDGAIVMETWVAAEQ
jgi:hypothetical protein